MRRCLLPLFWLAATVPLHAQVPALGSTVKKSGGAVTGVTFRVWAPNALAVAVAGDFNSWNTSANALSKEAGTPWNGIWTTTVAAARPGQAYKYVITPSTGAPGWN